MCDYSLHSVASRPARVRDKLLTTKFSNSVTRGFAAVGEPNVAVCLLSGTEIAFDKEAECGHVFSRIMPSLRFGKTGQKLADSGRSIWTNAIRIMMRWNSRMDGSFELPICAKGRP